MHLAGHCSTLEFVSKPWCTVVPSLFGKKLTDFLGFFSSAELEVARMSTDGNLPDLKFPQTGGQGNSIHLSANTLKQHGRNGEWSSLFLCDYWLVYCGGCSKFILVGLPGVHDPQLQIRDCFSFWVCRGLVVASLQVLASNFQCFSSPLLASI